MKRRVCGIDEVGRGALAGPLVLAAVVYPEDFAFGESEAIRDSKLLTINQRIRAYEVVMKTCLDFELEVVEPERIDEKGVHKANLAGFRSLVKRVDADEYILDGPWGVKVPGKSVRSIVKADETEISVMAASILAKVERDKMMIAISEQFPGYNWERNVGYGTREHLEALRAIGKSDFHRKTFLKSS